MESLCLDTDTEVHNITGTDYILFVGISNKEKRQIHNNRFSMIADSFCTQRI